MENYFTIFNEGIYSRLYYSLNCRAPPKYILALRMNAKKRQKERLVGNLYRKDVISWPFFEHEKNTKCLLSSEWKFWGGQKEMNN